MTGVRSILILSNGPVPTTPEAVVEGGGLRCWGLARGLQAHGWQPVIGVNHCFGDQPESVAGMPIHRWRLDEEFAGFLARFRVILVSFCMGDLTRFVLDHRRPGQILIGDAYVPIHLEVSARESQDLVGETEAYQRDLQDWNRALQELDLLLIASPAQRLYYQGLLAALGQMDPTRYRWPRLLEVPFGVHPEELLEPPPPVEPTRLRLLWSGGVYPWFDLAPLLEGLTLARQQGVPVELTLVGLKNPFVNHPHFVACADRAVTLAQGTDGCVLQDWVPYQQRLQLYRQFDWLVTISRPGPENGVSWRTRLADCVAATLPVLSNGGDPFFEHLHQSGGGVRFEGLDAEAFARRFRHLWAEQPGPRCRQALRDLQPTLVWSACLAPLVTLLDQPQLIPAAVAAPELHPLPARPPLSRRLNRLRTRVRHLGRRTLVRLGGANLSIQLRSRLRQLRSAAPHLWLVSHQLDHSGAPKVLMDIARDLAARRSGGGMTLLSYGHVVPELAVELERLGVRVWRLEPGQLPPWPRRGDRVLLNTVALPAYATRLYLRWHRRHAANQLQWFAHEDDPGVWLTPEQGRRLAVGVRAGVELLVPSRATARHYERFLGLAAEQVQVQPLKLDLPSLPPRPPEDFDCLRLQISGAIGDGRKAQLRTLGLFLPVLDACRQQPERYRPFELHLIGLGDDFLSRELQGLGDAILGDRFRAHGRCPRPQALALMRQANCVLCNSYEESLALFVLEGMAFGQVVLRNGSSGHDETLEPGGNGYSLGDEDATAIEAILRLLDRRATPTEQLVRFSRRSLELVRPFQAVTYEHLLNGQPRSLPQS